MRSLLLLFFLFHHYNYWLGNVIFYFILLYDLIYISFRSKRDYFYWRFLLRLLHIVINFQLIVFFNSNFVYQFNLVIFVDDIPILDIIKLIDILIKVKKGLFVLNC